MTTSLAFAPLLPYVSPALMALAILLAAFSVWRRTRFPIARILFLAFLAVLFLNPLTLRSTGHALPNRALVVIDRSASQSLAGRDDKIARLSAHLKEELSRLPNLEMTVIEAGNDAHSRRDGKTYLFSAIDEALKTIPSRQRAGIILVTDGQAHDVPDHFDSAPLHVLLTGNKDEFDRNIEILSAPRYGIFKEAARFSVRVNETGGTGSAPVILTVHKGDQILSAEPVTPGAAQDVSFPLNDIGDNTFTFSVAAAEGELSTRNNAASVSVRAVRDRLRVLLVSGYPHRGERAWRDLLKSDPNVDLVHFTILRTLTAADPAPMNEMALIPFPTHELFEKKTDTFNLIIFDNYTRFDMLPPRALGNVAQFVKNGGALLLTLDAHAGGADLFDTPLGDILPVTRGGTAPGTEAFIPKLTADGMAHPVTAGLADGQEKWGMWFTQAAAATKSDARTLITGKNDQPLLVLGTAEKGRTAVLLSDNIWLWSREGRGPARDLLRNIAHWLMKEPELEENRILAKIENGILYASAAPDKNKPEEMILTRPDGTTEKIPLTARGGRNEGATEISENGLYRIAYGDLNADVLNGTGGRESADIVATDKMLRAIAEKSGGRLWWESEAEKLAVRYGDSDRAGIGLLDRGASDTARLESRPLLPPGWMLVMIAAGLFLVWRREGQP